MRRIATGSPFEAALGYSRAVVKGNWCFVSGTTGYDYATMSIPPDAAAQARNCFSTIAEVLGQAGFAMGDIVRVQYTLADRAFVDEVAPVLGEILAEVRPAATMVIARLIREDMLIEVEVTAMKE